MNNQHFFIIFVCLVGVFCEQCKNGDEARIKIHNWIQDAMQNCKNESNCHVQPFYDTDITNIQKSPHSPVVHVVSGWSQWPVHNVGWQGVFYFDKPPTNEGELQGVYIYPDWSSCVQGNWTPNNFILTSGYYCSVTEACINDDGDLKIKTKITKNFLELAYNPPTYHSFGLPATQMDPFENNTVVVKNSVIEGEGLFATRDVAKGDLVSFYSGFFVHKDFIFNPLNRTLHLMTIQEKMWVQKYTLQFSNETHSNKFWFDIVVDLPPKFESLEAYRVTLGHKANHSFRNNAMYTLYTAHPVLGTVMSIIAKEDIKAGDEVTTDYHYPPEIYKALNITLGDNECSQGKCSEVIENDEKPVTTKLP